MGILNITPDSFFDGGKYQQSEFILQRVGQMLDEGADIIDVGAYSSRPGADDVSEKVELNRLSNALKVIRNQYSDIVISVDTFRSNIAKAVVEEFNVDIINDISGGDLDSKMFSVIQQLNVPYIIMHMKGNPKNMQIKPSYKNDVVYEIIDYFSEKVEKLNELGVHDIIIDPGFGFAKNLDHNYILLDRLQELNILEMPILVGVSRKSMIYRYLGCSPKEALNGTSALNMVALQNGANVLRVHDVKEAKECITLYSKLKSVNNNR